MGKGSALNTKYDKKVEEAQSLKQKYAKAYEVDFDEGAKLELKYMVLRAEILNEIGSEEKTIFNPLNLDNIKTEPTEIVCKDFLPLIKGAYNMIAGAGGVGKALRSSEKVLTPYGFKTMQDLAINDEVIGSDGNRTKVTGVFSQGKRQLYRIHFIDGTTVDADGSHIWSVYDGNKKNRHSLRNMTTLEMINSTFSRLKHDKRYGTEIEEFFYSIPLPSPMEFGKKTNGLDPYLLGLLLGDGGFTSGCINFTNGNKKIVDKLISLLPKEDTVTVMYRNGAYHCTIVRKIFNGTPSETFKKLDYLGLVGHKSVDKFIPYNYKNGNLECRKLIIQGLIDTDGYVVDGRLKEYSTSSVQLKEDFLYVGRSIGMFLTSKSRIPKYKHNGEIKNGQKNFRIYHKVQSKKTIVKIEKIDIDEAICITVDAQDKLFVTNGFNLTHNSTIALRLALHYLRANPNKRAFLVMGEDDSEEIKMRVDAIGRGFLHMNDYEISEVKKRMDFFTVDNSVPMRFLEMNSGTPSLNYGLIDKFSQYIKDKNIDFVVLDPLKKFHSCDENSNSAMDMLARDVFLEVAGKLKVVMLILHHSAKSKESIGSRGASTLTDTARIAYKITKHYLKNKETGELIEDDSKLGKVKISTIKDNKNIFSKYGLRNTNHGDISLYPSRIEVEEKEFVMTEEEIKNMRL